MKQATGVVLEALEPAVKRAVAAVTARGEGERPRVSGGLSRMHARQNRALIRAANYTAPRASHSEHHLNLGAAYLFAEIRRRQAAFTAAHPAERVIEV